MSKQINMVAGAAANGGLGIGVMTSAGNPWLVADGVADDLVNRKLALRVQPSLSSPQPALIQQTSSGPYAIQAPDGTTANFVDLERTAGLGFVPMAARTPRITKGGFNLYQFAAADFTLSGPESANYAISTVSGYNGIAAGDTVEGVALGSKTGSSTMLKWTANGSQAGAANTFITLNTALNVVPGDQKFGLWMYLSTDLTTNSSWATPLVTIDVSSGTTFNGDAHNYTFSFNANQIRPGWNFLVFRCDATAHPYGVTASGNGTDDMSLNLGKIRLYVIVPSGKTLTLYFDSLQSNFAQKPAVILSFDDSGDGNTMNNMVPAMVAAGFRGSMNCYGNPANDNTLTFVKDMNNSIQPHQIEGLNAAYGAGFDMSNHTLNHTNTSNSGTVRTQLLTDGQLAYMVLGQTAWQLAHGYGKGKEFYAAPQGRWDAVTISRLKAWGFQMCRMGQQHMNSHRTIYGYDNPLNMGWYSPENPVTGLTTACFNQWQADLSVLLLQYGCDVHIGIHHIIADVGTVTASTYSNISTSLYLTSFKLLLAWLQVLQQAGTIDVGSYSDLWYEQFAS